MSYAVLFSFLVLMCLLKYKNIFYSNCFFFGFFFKVQLLTMSYALLSSFLVFLLPGLSMLFTSSLSSSFLLFCLGLYCKLFFKHFVKVDSNISVFCWAGPIFFGTKHNNIWFWLFTALFVAWHIGQAIRANICVDTDVGWCLHFAEILSCSGIPVGTAVLPGKGGLGAR